MGQIQVVIQNVEAPHSQRYFWQVKAIEHLYYALLFSSSGTYSKRAEPWRSWLQMGFGSWVRDPPPDVGDADRLHLTTRSEGKKVTVKGSSPRADVLETLRRILIQLAAAPVPSVDGDAEARLEGALASKEVKSSLLQPVTACLRQNKLSAEETEAFDGMLRRSLRALTDPQVASMEITVSR